MGLLVALEGVDGSGKGTQSAWLVNRLRDANYRAELISFPRYEATQFGRAIGDFLNGRFGSLDSVSPFLACLLYAGDRFESRAVVADALDENDVVVLDRYVASNVAHQAAKVDGDQRRELIDWIQRIEHDIFGLPHADLTILLDLSARLAQQMISKKQPRSYTDRAADLHESDGGYLERVRCVYQDCARTGTDWVSVACADGDRMRSIDEIGGDLWRVVVQSLKQGQAGAH